MDDLLCALFRDSAPDMFALVVLFFCAIAAPISWKKAQFQDSLVWCGWEINFSHDTIQLVSAKLAKLDALIKSLLGNRRVPRKTLEQCIGLLIWATSIALHLRSWLAPLYADLNSPPGSMHSIPPQMWSAFRASLTKDLKTSHSLPGLWITASWKFQAAPCIAPKTSRKCLALASPHGCASRTPTTHTPAFPSQANSALLGWRRAFDTCLFSLWRGHTSCKLWLPPMRVPKMIWWGLGAGQSHPPKWCGSPRRGTCKT